MTHYRPYRGYTKVHIQEFVPQGKAYHVNWLCRTTRGYVLLGLQDSPNGHCTVEQALSDVVNDTDFYERSGMRACERCVSKAERL